MLIILFFAISITLMILLPVLLAALLRRRYIVPWFLFCVGMLAFVGSQLYHLPLNNWLADLGVIGPIDREDANFVQTALILGFSAAISETLARVVGYWVLFRYRLVERFEDSVMVGLGHGGIESMLFGAVLTAASLTALVAIQDVDLNTLGLSVEQMAAVTTQLELLESSPLVAFINPWERLSAMSLHVVASVMVWLSFKRRKPIYVLAAVLYHAFFDVLAVTLPQLTGNLWIVEAVLFAAALAGLAWLWYVWPRTEKPVRQLNSARTDLYLFKTALLKELKQQWRTKRVIVIAAVFLLFGLLSPVLAKFTPELLTSIEGAEQFADLIPTPTTADAMEQYIRNITQFGFILVIVLGMGAVAGEKEKGTAAMIISKPLTRWSFILSKFTAQALVYLVAILLGAVGAFYYTLVLFEGFKLAPFLFGNVLLWLWLMVFAAVTILASTAARTTAVAAGIAFAGSVLLFLAGSLPQIGQLMPSGLVIWAAQLGLAGELTANGGALVMALVLIAVGLISAVAFMEQQEL